MSEDIEKLVSKFQTDPENENVFNTLKEHFFLSRNWKGVVHLLVTRARFANNPSLSAQHYYEASLLYRDRLKDLTGRRRMLKDAFAADAGFEPAARELGLLLAEEGPFEDAVQALEAALPLAKDRKTEKTLKRKLAGCFARLKRPDRAAEILKELLDGGPQDAEIQRQLEKMYASSGQWQALADMLEARIAPNGEEDRETRFRLATLYRDRLDRPLDAASCFEALVRDKPNPMILTELEKIYTAHDRLDDLAGVLEKQASLARPREAPPIQFRLGTLLREKLGRPGEGARWIEKALEPSSAGPDRLKTLEKVFREASLFPELVALLRQKAERLKDPAGKADVLADVGRICRDSLDDPEEALAAFQAAFAFSTARRDLVEEIVSTFRRAGRLPALADWLEETAGDERFRKDRPALLRRAADVLQELSLPDRLADVLWTAWKEEPGDDVFLHRLSQALEDAGRSEELAELLSEQAERTADPGERVHPLMEKARLLAGTPGREGDAVSVYRDILAIRPDHLEALGELVALLRRLERHEELLDLFEQAVDLTRDKTEVAGLHHQSGRLLLDVMGDPERALEKFRAALYVQSDHLDAARGLVEAARALRDTALREEALARLATLEPDLGPRVEAMEERAALLSDAGRLEDAASILEDVTALDPARVEALKDLERILGALGKHRERASALERLSTALLDREEAARTQETLGTIYRDRLDDQAAASEAFERALAFDPGKTAYLDALDEIYAAMDRPADRVRTLENLARSREGPEAVPILVRAAGIASESVSRDKALEILARARSIDPASELAHDMAVSLLQGSEQREALLEVLTSGFRHLPEARKPSIARDIGKTNEALGEVDEAVAWLAEARDLAPDDLEVLEDLAGLLEKAGRMQEAVECLEALAERAGEADGRARHLASVGRILETGLGRTAEALKRYAEAAREAPGAEGALEGMQRAAETLQDWDVAVEALELSLRSESSRLPALLPKLVRLHEEKRLDLESAIDAARRWRTAAPEDTEALRALARLHRRQGSFEALAGTLETLAAREEGKEARVAVLMDLAELRALRFEDVEGCRKALEEAASLAPDKPEPLEALERFHASRGDHEGRLDAISRLAALETDDAGKADRLFALGRLLEDRLDRPEEAQASFREVLERVPDHLPSLRALQRHARRKEDFKALAALVEREARLEGLDATNRRWAWLKLAQIRRDALEDDTGAIEAFREVLALDPRQRQALHGLEPLYARREEHEALAEVLSTQAEVLPHGRDRRNVFFRLGLFRLETLDDAPGAVEAFREALALDPAFLPALRKLQDTLGLLPEARERLAALDKEIEMDLPPPRRLELLRETGRGYRDLGEKEEAVERWMKVLETRPGDAEALDALEDLLDALDRTEDLSRVLKAKWKTARPRAERLRAGAKRAALLEDLLGKHDEARRLTRAVLEAGARQPALLERYRHQCERADDPEGLAWCLDREAEGAVNPERRLRLLLESGAIHRERLGHAEGAIGRYEEAWKACTGSRFFEPDMEADKAFGALETLYAETGRHEALVALHRRRAAFQEGEARGESFARAGKVCEEWLKADGLAIRLFHLALEYAPGHLEAVRGLARLLASQGRHGEGVAWRLREASLVEGTEGKVDILMEVASILEQNLDDPDRAIETYRDVLDLMPGSPLAFEGLARLLESRERYGELADLYVAQAAHGSEEEAMGLFLKAGEALWRRLEDPDSAVPYLKRAFDAEPGDDRAFGLLEEALTASGDEVQLAKVKEKRLAILPGEETERRLALTKEIGRLYMSGAGNLRRAVGYWVAALKASPADAEAIHHLQDLYRREGDLTNLARMLEHEVEVSPEPARRRALQARLVDLYMRRLGAFEDAVRVCREILLDEPGNLDVLESLKRAYRASGKTEELLKTYELELAQTKEHKRRAEILLTMGRLRARTGLLEEAAEALREALETGPGREETVEVLLGVYRSMDDARGTAEMLTLRAGFQGDAGKKVEDLLEAGRKWEEAGGLEGAAESYRAVRAIRPREAEAIEGLSRLLEPLGRWQELVEILDVKAETTRSEEEAVALYGKIGSVHLMELEDFERAEEAFRLAIDMDPHHLPSLEGLEQVARKREDWDGTVSFIDRQAEGHEDRQRRAYLLVEAGRILLEGIGDPEGAKSRFQAALEGDPESTEALFGIASIAFEKEDWAEAAGPLQKLAALIETEEEDPARRAQIHFRCGFVLERLGRPPEDRILHFERALEADPDHLMSLREAERIYFEAERWSQAAPLVERLLERHGSSLREGEANRLRADQGILLWKMGDPERGREILESLADPEEEPRVLKALETLFEETGAYDRAVETLERICSSFEEEEEIVAANKKLGRIFTDHMKDPEKGIGYFQKALELLPDDAQAGRALATAFEKAHRWTEAAQAWSVLAEGPGDREERVEARCRMGAIYLDHLADPKAARDAFVKALVLDPAHEEALEGVSRARGIRKEWKALANDYRGALKEKKDAPPAQRAILQFKVGEALWEEGDLPEAAEALEASIRLDPERTASRLLLARILEKRPRTLARAAEHYRVVVERAPYRTDALRRLCAIRLKTGSEKTAFGPAAVLVALRTHASKEYETYRAGVPEAPATEGCLDRKAVAAVLSMEGDDPTVLEVLLETDEHLGDAAGADLAKHGLRRRRKPEGAEEIVEQAENLATVLHAPPIDLLVAGQEVEEGVKLENLKPPALVTDPGFPDLPAAERVFLLGRALGLTLLKRATGLVEPGGLRHILFALVSGAVPEAEEEGGRDKNEKAFRKRVRGALPRRVRKRVEPALRRLWKSRNEIDLETFQRNTRALADRVGLILCGDPVAALHAKLRFDARLEMPDEMDSEEILRWIRKAPDIRELIGFIVSDAFHEALSTSRAAP